MLLSAKTVGNVNQNKASIQLYIPHIFKIDRGAVNSIVIGDLVNAIEFIIRLNATFLKNVTINGGLIVNGNLIVKGDIIVKGDHIVNGDLIVKGEIFAPNISVENHISILADESLMMDIQCIKPINIDKFMNIKSIEFFDINDPVYFDSQGNRITNTCALEPTTRYGFNGDDLMKLYPNLVTTMSLEASRAIDNNPDLNAPPLKQIKYTELIPLIVHKVQNLQHAHKDNMISILNTFSQRRIEFDKLKIAVGCNIKRLDKLEHAQLATETKQLELVTDMETAKNTITTLNATIKDYKSQIDIMKEQIEGLLKSVNK